MGSAVDNDGTETYLMVSGVALPFCRFSSEPTVASPPGGLMMALLLSWIASDSIDELRWFATRIDGCRRWAIECD